MRGANRHGVVPRVGRRLATKHSGNTIVRTWVERGPRGVRLMGRTQELRESIRRRRPCYPSEPSSSAMPRGGLRRPRAAIFTTQPAIIVITAAPPATAASESSKPAADRARDRSAFADFELRISNETTAERRAVAAVLPLSIGMAIAVIAVRERIEQREHRHSGARQARTRKSRDSGFSPAGCSGMTFRMKQKDATGFPVASQLL
jgi:hypothetical protein